MLPILKFHKRPNGNYHSWCKSCKYDAEKQRRAITPRTEEEKMKVNAQKKKKWAENKEYRDKQRAYQLKKNFDITIEQYNEMLIKCNNACEICGSSDTKHAKQKYLNVDHCHDTGKVRGLLCHACNIGLGKFEDNPKFLLKAIKYLKERSDEN